MCALLKIVKTPSDSSDHWPKIGDSPLTAECLSQSLQSLILQITFALNYVPLDQIPLNNVSAELIKEFKTGPCYGIYFDYLLVMFCLPLVNSYPFQTLLWDLSHMLAMASILIGFCTLLLMVWKLHSLRNIIAKNTRKLHAAFMMVRAISHSVKFFFSAVSPRPNYNCDLLLYHEFSVQFSFSTGC